MTYPVGWVIAPVGYRGDSPVYWKMIFKMTCHMVLTLIQHMVTWIVDGKVKPTGVKNGSL